MQECRITRATMYMCIHFDNLSPFLPSLFLLFSCCLCCSVVLVFNVHANSDVDDFLDHCEFEARQSPTQHSNTSVDGCAASADFTRILSLRTLFPISIRPIRLVVASENGK